MFSTCRCRTAAMAGAPHANRQVPTASQTPGGAEAMQAANAAASGIGVAKREVISQNR